MISPSSPVKIRAVAARSSTTSSNYNIYTQSTVCGVRGTDFIIGNDGKLVVGEGSVEYIKMDTGESLMVNTGMAADAFAAAFEVVVMTAEQLASAFQAFEFVQLDPFAVEGHTPPPAEPATAEEEEPADEPAAEEDTGDDGGTVIEQVPDTTATEGTDAPSGSESSSLLPEQESPLDKLLAPVREFLGMEIGSITIDDKTYSKVLLQPEFAIGDLQMALYLPIIYNNDMFDPNDWYHPAGNDEWSFGTDQGGDVADIATDILSDLFLKIKYVKWGEQRDPFYFKFGNVDDMTLGHGILMENYANDSDFPVVRKVGFNMGITGEKSTTEFVSDDLSNIQLIGGRVAFGKKFKFGISSIVDINADINAAVDGEVLSYGTTTLAESQFINFGVDLDLSILESDFLSIVLFADAGDHAPYFGWPAGNLVHL